VCYIDDCVVAASSFDDAVRNIEVLLKRFRAANLKLKPSKCKLFQSSIRFLGHRVSRTGIEVDSDKVVCVSAWKFPRSVSELRSFISLCSSCRAFYPGFATVAEPLSEMLSKGVALQLSERRQRAFDELQDFLTHAPVLSLPRDGDYVLDVDASLFSAGAVSQQYRDGFLRVNEYASRTFNRAERNYCVTRRDMAALIFSLRHFRQYLLDRRFVVRVDDHMALTYYRKCCEPIGQHA
jgi:RNase H-like domain found in reverse transcriptase/Reverse transcriptase (RNA-dependent DNA polymerase)